MPLNLVEINAVSAAFWGAGMYVLWTTRAFNTRPIRPDWRKLWARRVFGIWGRYLAIFSFVFSGLWIIHDIGGFWEVVDLHPREKKPFLTQRNVELSAVLDSRLNQVKTVFFLILLYADHLLEKRTSPDAVVSAGGPEWSLRLLFGSIGVIVCLSLW